MFYRFRKLVGTILLLIFVPFYTLVAVALAGALLPGTSGWTQLAYYLVAGLAWVVPAGLIIALTFRRPKAT